MSYSRNLASSILRRPERHPQPCLPWDEISLSAGAGVAVGGVLDPAETPPEPAGGPPGDLTGRDLQDHTSSTVARPASPPPPAAPRPSGRTAASSCAAGSRVRPRRRYDTFEIARTARRIMMMNGRDYAEALTPVACAHCGGWHLTKERHRG